MRKKKLISKFKTNKLISIIRTEQTLLSDKTEVKTYEICQNGDSGNKPFMQPLQRDFLVYEIINRAFGESYRSLVNRNEGGFDTIEDCERAIELSSRVSFTEKGWFKSIETTLDGKGNTIINWVKRIETTFDENNQIINGIKQSFYGNGVLSNLKTYKNGKLHGIVKTWYENGFLKYEVKYVEGKREGYQNSYDKYGSIESETSFKNGKLNGISKNWRFTSEAEKNIIQLFITYKENKRHGICMEWHANGILAEESNYLEGEKHGAYKYFDKEGNIIREELYLNGIEKKTQN